MKALLTLVLILGAAVASQDFAKMIGSLKEKVGATVYGESISDLVEMHLGQGSAVQEVLQILGGVLKQLEADQNTDDIDHSTRGAQFEKNIQRLEQNVESLSSENQDNNRAIGDLSEEIASITSTVASLHKQLSLLNARDESIRQSRSDEGASHQKRVASNNKQLNAVSRIKTQLIKVINDSNGILIQKSEQNRIVKEIKKELGERSPIAVLAQLTTKMDHDLAVRVIQALETLEVNLGKALDQDEQNEQTSSQLFEAVIAELTTVRDKLADDYTDIQSLEKIRRNDLAIATRRQGEIQVDLEQTQNLLIQTRVQSDSFEGNYLSRRQDRQGELESIKEAYAIINDHAEQLDAKN